MWFKVTDKDGRSGLHNWNPANKKSLIYKIFGPRSEPWLSDIVQKTVTGNSSRLCICRVDFWTGSVQNVIKDNHLLQDWHRILALGNPHVMLTYQFRLILRAIGLAVTGVECGWLSLTAFCSFSVDLLSLWRRRKKGITVVHSGWYWGLRLLCIKGSVLCSC